MTEEGSIQPASYPLISKDDPAAILDALVSLKVSIFSRRRGGAENGIS